MAQIKFGSQNLVNDLINDLFLKLFHMFIGAEPIMLSYSEKSDFTVFLQEGCPARWEVSVVE